MFKKATVAVLFALGASSASADWAGPYAGADVVYGFGNAKSDVSGSGTNTIAFLAKLAESEVNNGTGQLNGHTNGASLAGHVGYLWQRNALVYGLEADLQGPGMRGTSSFSKTDPYLITAVGVHFTTEVTQSNRIDYLGTLRGRIGYAGGENWMVYATGGLAYAGLHSTIQLNETSTPALGATPASSKNPADSSSFRAGWALGGGAEFAMSKQWSVRAEYLYYDLGKTHGTIDTRLVAPPQLTSVNFDSATRWNGSIVRVGLGYRF